MIPTTAASGPHCGLDDLIHAAKRARDGKIAVLTFHGVPDLDHPHVHTEPEIFGRFAAYLRDDDYQVVAMRDLAGYVDLSKRPQDPYGPIQRRLKAKTQGQPSS